MSIDSKPRPGAWLVVILLAVVAALNYLDRVTLTTMRTSLIEAIPMTDTKFGLLTSVFLWFYACMSPVGGFLADRVSRAKVIIGSLFLWSAATWLTARATASNELLVARAFMGISEACYLPAALALIADYHPGRTRSFATGLHMIGISVGQGLGGLGGWIAERHSWQYTFSLFGGVGVVYSLILLLTLRDATTDRLSVKTPRPSVKFGTAFTSLIGSGAFRLALAYWGLLGVATWAVIGWLPTLLGERFHLTQGAAGLSATGLLQPAVWIGLLIGGAWSDRWSQTHKRGRIFVTMIGLGIAAPSIFFAVNAQAYWLAMAAFMLWALSTAFANANMMPILCLIVDERYRATGYGLLNLFSSIVGGLTIYIGGALRDAHIAVDRIFICAAFLTAFCVVLLALIRPMAAPTSVSQETSSR
jgi:MFS family permease